MPTAWEYGALSDWCASGDVPGFRVERPGGGVLSIGCPSLRYGLRFLTPDEIPQGKAEAELLRLPGGSRDLTAEVLHWALSPGWSGGLVGEVPLDGPQRQPAW